MVIWHCSSRRGLSKELQWSVAVLQLFNNSLLINPLWKFFFFNKVDLEPSFAKNIQLRKNQTSDHRIWLKRNLTVNPVQGLASHLCDCILGGSETVCIDMSKHFATQKYNIVYIYIWLYMFCSVLSLFYLRYLKLVCLCGKIDLWFWYAFEELHFERPALLPLYICFLRLNLTITLNHPDFIAVLRN
jgi:hypothetical protein